MLGGPGDLVSRCIMEISRLKRDINLLTKSPDLQVATTRGSGNCTRVLMSIYVYTHIYIYVFLHTHIYISIAPLK